jgi:hypothetical protein
MCIKQSLCVIHVYLPSFKTYPCVQRLMSSHIIEDLTSCILDFQANIIRVTYRKKTTLVEPDVETSHAAMLKQIWTASRLKESPDENGENTKWRKLGFDTENLTQEFGEVGVLGLDCLVCGIGHLTSRMLWLNAGNIYSGISYRTIQMRSRRFGALRYIFSTHLIDTALDRFGTNQSARRA